MYQVPPFTSPVGPREVELKIYLVSFARIKGSIAKADSCPRLPSHRMYALPTNPVATRCEKMFVILSCPYVASSRNRELGYRIHRIENH